MSRCRLLFAALLFVSLPLAAQAADTPAAADPTASSLPTAAPAPAPAKANDEIPLPAESKATPPLVEKSLSSDVAPKAAERNVAIPMDGRAGFMLSARFGTHWSTYGLSGSFKYWVFERFAIKPTLTLNHISQSTEGGSSESRYSYGLSNIFQFSPWIGKHTRFNVGVGLGFDISKFTSSEDGEDYETKCYRVFMPMEMGIEYHIRPWLSWEIGASMDFFQYMSIPKTKGHSEETHYSIDLNTARAYTGITLYTD